MLLLAGDIGGTRTRLALFDLDDERLCARAQDTYPSTAYGALAEIIADFAERHGVTPDLATLGIAGPVHGGCSRTTNLPWLVEAVSLERQFGLQRVRLLNDLEAMGYGVLTLLPHHVEDLCPGQPQVGNAAVLAAGTGLGLAGLFWDGATLRPFATEGGHAAFGPENPRQRSLHAFMAARQGNSRVSWERVLSGAALPALLEFIEQHEGVARRPPLDEALASGDPGAVIADFAQTGECEACALTLELFVELYGGHAGNVALEFMARAGVYLGGGIAPRILPVLRHPRFREAFVGKGRMRELLETVPVRVVLEEKIALLGAAHCTRLDLGRS